MFSCNRVHLHWSVGLILCLDDVNEAHRDDVNEANQFPCYQLFKFHSTKHVIELE